MAGDPLYGLQHVEDPCEQINDALLVFLKWFLLVRRTELPTLEIFFCSLAERGITASPGGTRTSGVIKGRVVKCMELFRSEC